MRPSTPPTLPEFFGKCFYLAIWASVGVWECVCVCCLCGSVSGPALVVCFLVLVNVFQLPFKVINLGCGTTLRMSHIN